MGLNKEQRNANESETHTHTHARITFKMIKSTRQRQSVHTFKGEGE